MTQSKAIQGFENYNITSDGLVFTKGKLMKIQDNGYGYKLVRLWLNKKYYAKYIHRLVAEAFIGPINELQVNHKDGIKENNNVNNLEIVSAKSNTAHALKMGLRKRDIKVLTEPQVREIQKLLKDGLSTREVALKMGRSQRCIQYIKKGQHMGKLGFKKLVQA